MGVVLREERVEFRTVYRTLTSFFFVVVLSRGSIPPRRTSLRTEVCGGTGRGRGVGAEPRVVTTVSVLEVYLLPSDRLFPVQKRTTT